MGNAQSGSSLTRTTVALDSFIAELGGDIIFEKKCAIDHPAYNHSMLTLHEVLVQLASSRR